MNERIRQLAAQATKQYSATYYTQEWIEGFAKLIVNDCAAMAECFHHSQYDFTGDLELHEFMREQFGVE